MSELNVNLVRRGWEAALSDPPDWETLDELIDPRHGLHTLVGLVEGAHEALGVEGFRQFRDRLNQTGEWRVDVEEILPSSDDLVVTRIRLEMRAQQSGVELEAERGIVQTIADGRIVRTEVFPTPDEALKAAGVSK